MGSTNNMKHASLDCPAMRLQLVRNTKLHASEAFLVQFSSLAKALNDLP
jgi:hypothetical protein